MMQGAGRTMCSIFIDLLKVRVILEAGKLQKGVVSGDFGFWVFFWLHSYLDINKDLAGQGTGKYCILKFKISLESF